MIPFSFDELRVRPNENRRFCFSGLLPNFHPFSTRIGNRTWVDDQKPIARHHINTEKLFDMNPQLANWMLARTPEYIKHPQTMTGQTFTLNTGAKIPALGLGTWQSDPGRECRDISFGIRDS